MISIAEMEAHLTLLGYVFDDGGIEDKVSEYFVQRSGKWQLRSDANPSSWRDPATYFVCRVDDEWGGTILETESYETALRKLYELVTES